MRHHHLITVAPTGAETAKSDVPALPVTLDELVGQRQSACEAAGAAMVHVHIRDDGARPTLDLGRLRDTVAAAARGHRPSSCSCPPAARSPTRSSTGWRVLDAEPDSVLAHLRHGQLRRRRVPEPVAVHGRALPAHPGARDRPRVRAVRPRARAALNRLLDKYGAPVRRPGPLRPGDGRARAACRAPPAALVAAVQALPAGRDAGRRRHRAYDAAGGAGRAVRRWAPAGRHGGHADVRPGRAGPRQRPARRAGRELATSGPAPADVDGRGP